MGSGPEALPPNLPQPPLQTLRPHPRPPTPCPQLHYHCQVPAHGHPPGLPALARPPLLAPAPLQVPRLHRLHGCRLHELRDARRLRAADRQQPQHAPLQAPHSPMLQGRQSRDPRRRHRLRVGLRPSWTAALAPPLLHPRWAASAVQVPEATDTTPGAEDSLPEGPAAAPLAARSPALAREPAK